MSIQKKRKKSYLRFPKLPIESVLWSKFYTTIVKTRSTKCENSCLRRADLSNFVSNSRVHFSRSFANTFQIHRIRLNTTKLLPRFERERLHPLRSLVILMVDGLNIQGEKREGKRTKPMRTGQSSSQNYWRKLVWRGRVYIIWQFIIADVSQMFLNCYFGRIWHLRASSFLSAKPVNTVPFQLKIYIRMS